MVKFTGLCPSLKKSVEFDVTEIIELPTKRGVKYQVKGDFEGRTCSTFTSKAKAMTLREAIGGRTMAAEEDSTGQAHQEDGVNPLRGEVEPLAQGQEPSSQLPLKETVSEPITGTDVGVEPIESLELPDLPESSMGTQFDESPAMEGDVEIASMMPEGDGQSIGNNAPMNPDVPLHAEETSEEVGQEEPSAEQLPLSETVPESFSPADSQVAPIDDLSVSMADPVSRMEVEFDQAPEIITEFTISMPQPFGDGRSIGNITPMNPDVPFASESVEFNADPLDETSLEVPPAVCFVEKIPPVVWENMTLETKMEYGETGDEGLLVCPQCGITKEGLRDVGGYCSVSDPEGESYDSSIDCPYQKHFAPSHWVDSEIVVGHITESEVEVSERLPSSVDMPMNDAITSRLLYTKIPFFLWDKINSLVGAGVQAFPDDSGLNYTLQYYGNQKNHLDNLINVAEGETDIMFGSERYHATVLASEDGGYYIKTDSLRPYGAEEDKGRYGHMFDYPIVYADDSSDRRGYLIGYDNGEIWNTGIMYGGIERNRDFINDVGQQRLKRRNLRRENSSTDDPDFDPEKADRNKDGVISDWERAVGNAVAKGIRESREKKGAETFEAEGYKCRWNGKLYRRIGRKLHHTRTLTGEPITYNHRVCMGCGEGCWSDVYDAETFEADGDDTYFLFYYKDSPEQNRRNQVDEEYWDDWNMLEDYIDDGASKEEALEQFQGLVNLWGKSYPHSIIEAELVEIDRNTGEEKTITSWKANAKEFNVEFDDWADQEMLTHGKDVSFKEWAKEEGKKHGDMDLTDWAEHEEESHDERYGAETFESPTQLPQRPHIYQHNGVQYQIKRNSYKPTGKDLMADIDFTNDRGEWIETIETDYHANIDEVHNDAQRIIDEYKAKSDRPSLKKLGILLGVGALATYLAPENIKKFFNR